MSNLTTKAIKDSFIKLLEIKPLSQITVKMIVEDCGINRNSFYYHYQDITQLLEEIVTEQADDIIKKYPTIDSIDDCAKKTIEFMMQYKMAAMHIYNSVNRDMYEQHLMRVCEYVVGKYIDTVLGSRQIEDQAKSDLISYYKWLIFGMAIDWMNHNMKGDMTIPVERILVNRMKFGHEAMMQFLAENEKK